MDRFEYKVLNFTANLWKGLSSDKLEEELNTLGRQGWELTTSNPKGQTISSQGILLIFKRKV